MSEGLAPERRKLITGLWPPSCLFLASTVFVLVSIIHAGHAAGASTAAGASGANLNTFSLAAEGDALLMVASDPSLPIVQTVAASPYGASASLNSVGQGLADAGAPYSPIVASLPGTVNGLGAGDLPALPPLPGYVSASYPSSPTASQIQGGYELSATSSQNDSKGLVNIGVSQPGASQANLFASAETTANSDGSVTDSASAGVDVLNFGGLLDLGNISSSATMTEQASQPPIVKSTTHLGSITLLGLPTGIIGTSLSLLGASTALPLSTAILPALDAALAPVGISLAYLPQKFVYTDNSSSTGATPESSKTLQSVDSGALQVSFTRNIQTQGQVTAIFTLGRVYLSATNGTGVGPSSLSTVPSTALPNSSVNPQNDLGESTGAGGIGDQAIAPGTQSLATGSPAGGQGSAGSQPSTPNLERTVQTGPSGESLYLVLVAAALAALAGSQLIRLLAIRLALTRRSGPRPSSFST